MPARRLALVVTVDRYDHPGLRALAAPAADAQALADVLGDPDLGAFELEVLHNPNSWAVYERVEGLLADRSPDDLVLLHFSCHGLKDIGGELYLATSNTVPDRLASTAVDSAWITKVMQRSRAQRVVLLLDCCYGGAFERGVLARAGDSIDVGDQFRPGHLGEGRGRAVITASTAMEYAFEGTQLSDGAPSGPSVFTGALAEGIRSGDADRDQDGYVALDELYDYVYERVRRHSPQQTPCKWEFGLRGELYVSRNPHRRVAPTRLPQELVDLLDHPTPTARLAAVDELARLAAGTNLTRAAAARLALEQMADDDSRRVSTAATAALRDTAVSLAVPVVDFGVVRPGTPRVTTDVAVAGPPLALASEVTVVGAGLRARVEAGVLRISWVPRPGRLDGTVTLSGPAGEAHLRVTAALPQPASANGPLFGGRIRAGGGPPWWHRPRAAATLSHGPAAAAETPVVPADGTDPGGEHHTLRLGWRRGLWLFAVVLLMTTLIGLGIRTAMLSRTDGATPAGPPSPAASAPQAASPTVRRPVSLDRPVASGTITTGGEPEDVAVSPDSRTLYVTNMRTRTLSMIDVAAPADHVDVQLPNTPRFVALSRDGSRAYVSMYEDNGSGSAVVAVDTTRHDILTAVPTGPKPYALSVGPDDRVWIPIHDAKWVEIRDPKSLKLLAKVGVPENPHSVALSEDGRHAYTPNHESNKVSIIDARTVKMLTSVSVDVSPHSVAVTPDGDTVAVANFGAGTVNWINPETRKVVGRTAKVGSKPQSIIFSSDGAHAYVVNEADGTLSVLRTLSGRPTATLRVGKSPRVVATAPDGRRAYVTNGDDGTLTVLRIAD